jgi:MtN3 and saliva related transmembrane protein
MFKIIGMCAAILTTSSFIPQAIKTIKTKDTSGISLYMYLIFTSGVFMWILYSIYIKDIAIFLANLVTFVFSSIILGYKIKSEKKL